MTHVGGAGHRDLQALLHALRVGKVVEQLPNAHGHLPPPAPGTPQTAPVPQAWAPIGGSAAQQAAQHTATQHSGGTQQGALGQPPGPPRGGTAAPRNAAPHGRYGPGTAFPPGPTVPFPPTTAPPGPGGRPFQPVPGSPPPTIPGSTAPPGTVPGGPAGPPTTIPGALPTTIPGVPAPTIPGAPAPSIPGVPAPVVPGAQAPVVPGTQAPSIPGTQVPVPGVPVPAIPGAFIPGPPSGAPDCPYPENTAPAGAPPPRTAGGGPLPYAFGIPSWEAVVPIRVSPQRPAAGPGAPVDGFRPGEESALHALQTRLRESLQLVGSMDDAVHLLDDHLFTARPELRPLFPPSADVHRQQLHDALTWLVDNLDRPQVLAAGCGQLGPVLREFGVQRAHIDAFGMAMLDALRASMGGAWRPEHDVAWRSTWKLAAQWLQQGEEDAGYAPLTWLGTVVARQDWRHDLSILWIRTYLPYPHRPGQRAVLEADGATHAYPIGNPPTPDHTIEVHVESHPTDYTGLALLRDAEPGERVRLHPAADHLPVDRTSRRDLLLVAEGPGIATMKALMTEVAWRRQHRAVRLFVGVRTVADIYDLDPLHAIAAECLDAQVQVVVAAGPQGRFLGGSLAHVAATAADPADCDVYVDGSPALVAALADVFERVYSPTFG
ncbi:hypothetical protein ACIA8K_00350 [Catenuloplanes sp. NPDC051500]|uniref:hypothetical protein n=1 Tax=Catenuloplanes sp. NPDC051500 TaxID=3363959 RepID=UPI0037ADD44F